MNPLLDALQPYPFEKLARLRQGIEPPVNLRPISLSIGEPQHPTPGLIQQALIENVGALAKYPSTRGLPELRTAIAKWLCFRFKLPVNQVDPEKHVLPCNGTREALFAFAQTLVNPAGKGLVLMPNPFYQIYEGAALLAGAQTYFINSTPESDFLPNIDSIPADIWNRCELLYICSPGNPTGAVMDSQMHFRLIELAEKFNFVIASDECYSEIYNDEANPPPSLLQSAYEMGNKEFKRCVVFHSLSKRSNVPGLRSGFVAGDECILSRFLLYRTYHGAALSITAQKASIAAWEDEEHVITNRSLYRDKFNAVSSILGNVLDITVPHAGFYLWPDVKMDDQAFTCQLLAKQNVAVLPGSYLSREHSGINPGYGRIRMALVAPVDDCVEAAHRIHDLLVH